MTSQTRTRTFRDPAAQAAAVVHIQKQNITCDGCAFLQRHPRAQCRGEGSEHFRRPRETYHARCTLYTPQGVK